MSGVWLDPRRYEHEHLSNTTQLHSIKVLTNLSTTVQACEASSCHRRSHSCRAAPATACALRVSGVPSTLLEVRILWTQVIRSPCVDRSNLSRLWCDGVELGGSAATRRRLQLHFAHNEHQTPSHVQPHIPPRSFIPESRPERVSAGLQHSEPRRDAKVRSDEFRADRSGGQRRAPPRARIELVTPHALLSHERSSGFIHFLGTCRGCSASLRRAKALRPRGSPKGVCSTLATARASLSRSGESHA